MIPLRLVADIEETDGPNQIQRENGRRRIAVFANSDGSSDLGQAIAEIRRILAETPLPQGYTTRLEGTFQAQEEATQLIGALSLVSLALIFLVLYSRYRSSVLALIVMVNIPLALIGSVLALMIAEQPLSVASMIGFVTLAGISARNGILKISHFINLALHEGERFGRGLVVRGSLERMTPVLMTALAAGLALLPLLMGAGEPGREILPGRGDDLRRARLGDPARRRADAASVPNAGRSPLSRLRDAEKARATEASGQAVEAY